MQMEHIELVCVCADCFLSSRSVSSSRGSISDTIHSTEPLQRETSLSSCVFFIPPLCTHFVQPHILSSLSFHPTTYIILSSSDHSSSPLSLTLLLLYLSLALTALQHCRGGVSTSTQLFSAFVSTCKVC